MALNFPRPSQSPYIDPDSGLKYIYNPTIGAWESAIQPPAIVTYDCQPPDIIIEGFLWFNNCDLTLYIRKDGTWIPVVDGEYGPVFIGINPPAFPGSGDLWWDPVSGVLFVFYVEQNTADPSSQWMPCFNGSGGGLGDTGGAFVGPFAPGAPAEGQLWFNTNNNILYIYTDELGWTANQSELSGVQDISGVFPIIIDEENVLEPTISIANATTSNRGSVQLASNNDTSIGLSGSLAVTPAGLKYALSDISTGFLPVASSSQAGIVELATAEEVVEGTNTAKAVTPAALNVALPQLGLTNPPGTVITYAGDTAPGGYLMCDGSTVSRADYPDLFTAIGTLYGPGDGTTTFVLPDLRNEFVRGWNIDKGTAELRTVGSFQGDAVGNHKHSIITGDIEGNDDNTNFGKGGRNVNVYTIETELPIPGAAETRPRNIAMMYCIKY